MKCMQKEPEYNMSLNTKCEIVLSFLIFMIALSSVPTCFAESPPCKFNVSCDDVESMIITKSHASWDKAGNFGEWRDVIVCIVYLTNQEQLFETMIKECNSSHYTVWAGTELISKKSTASHPCGEAIVFYEDSLDEVLKKAQLICPDKAPKGFSKKVQKHQTEN